MTTNGIHLNLPLELSNPPGPPHIKPSSIAAIFDPVAPCSVVAHVDVLVTGCARERVLSAVLQQVETLLPAPPCSSTPPAQG